MNNETDIQSVQKIMVAEPSWIVFSESFLSPELLDIRPIANFNEYVIGVAKQATCSSSNI